MKSVALLVQEIISIEVSRGPTRPPGLSRINSFFNVFFNREDCIRYFAKMNQNWNEKQNIKYKLHFKF